MSEHTPGPWVWRRPHGGADYYELVAIGDHGTHRNGQPVRPVVADDGSAGGEYSPTVVVDGPDGRLIAAAPQLLEELNECITDLVVTIGNIHSECNRDPVAANRWGGVTEHLRDRVRSARAAIAAAEGE